ncbi:helix-turn-helix domain-containing protein [Flagellimonas sp. HMM57]|uniref:helix-turn-helix domain-containing protein n=1 Tax=unclassified Flagellimonas TaxID=2644544 RepID=UPI0013D19287|nr:MULTISPECIES: helix-turn-helix transcriptional regulator [unclassified Flagellimonas]UII77276.1 helix-turn-helix domain-containing protein [Flagellimonas sp. HMM57]
MQQPELGLKIVELRKQKGFTQEELVDRCNINVRTLQRIESGEVSPRSYTIKTILSALDYDFETLHQTDNENAVNRIITVPPKEAKSIHNLLTVSLIAGILFLIVAVFEGIADYIRFEDGELIYGTWGHVAMKILVLVFNTLFIYGFLISGKLLKSYLMKIASVLFIFILFLFYIYDIISVFHDTFGFEIVILAESISFGAIGILFGIAILKVGKQLRTIAFAAGGMEVLMSLCLLTVFLAPLALFLFFPTVIVEVVLLYKIITLVREQM